MRKVVIKIGHQPQADKPVYLHPTGVVECGNFKYKGRHKKRFKEIYGRIKCLGYKKPRDGIIDVSHCEYWNATRIWYDYVVVKWIKTVSAGRIEKFAIETEIFLLREEIRIEFERAVENKWRMLIRSMDTNNRHWPKKAWQIL
jgi:hypothetical protein